MRYFYLFILSFIFFLGNSQTPINWTHTNGPEGSSGVKVVSSDKYIFYSDYNFLHRSSDGLLWESFPMVAHSIEFLHGDTIIIHEYVGNQLFKISVDAGESWEDLSVPLVNGDVIIGLTDSVLICSVDDVIYRSIDLGETWELLSNMPVSSFRDLFIDSDGLCGISEKKIFHADINGDNWEDISPDSPDKNFENIKRWGQVIIAHTPKRRYYSLDSGVSWSYVEYTGGGAMLQNVLWYEGVIYNTDPESSLDFGATWVAIDFENEGSSTHFLSLTSFKGDIYGISLNKGLLKLFDGKYKAVAGLDFSGVSDIEEGSGYIFATTPTYVFKYNLASEIWENVGLPISKTGYRLVESGENGLLVVSEENEQGFYISLDTGITWTHVGTLDALNVRAVLDDIVFASDIFGDTGMLRSDDGGQTWTVIDVLWDAEKIIKHKDYYLATTYPSKVLKSIDKGLTWVDFLELPEGLSVWDLASENGRLFTHYREFAGLHDIFSALYCSDNDGQDWYYCGDGLAQPPWAEAPFGISELFFGDGVYYIKIKGVGLYGSSDDCKTWLPIYFRDNTFELAQGTFFTSTYTFGGVFKFDPVLSQSGIMKGVVFWDKNGDGLMDSTETGLERSKVGVTKKSQNFAYFAYSRENGSYTLGVDTTSDTLRVKKERKYIDTIIPDYYLTESLGQNKNFAVSFIANITDLSIDGSYLMPCRPGFKNRIMVNYRNEGTISKDAIVSMKLDEHFSFIAAQPTPDQVFGDSLVWEIDSLEVFSEGQINVEFKVSTITPIGAMVVANLHINSGDDDFESQDNDFSAISTVVGSFDPNDKSVYPEDGLTKSEIEEGKEIYYTIRFQNTGTYLAEKVRITDIIDKGLDASSIHLVGSSHKVSSFTLNSGRRLEVVFEQINLLDSTTSEIDSHGFVTFAVKRKLLNSYNSAIENTAAIFFDFNEPIFTNTVSFGLKEIVGIHDVGEVEKDLRLHVFPNPTNGKCVIDLSQITSESLLSISDISGNVWVEKITPNSMSKYILNTELLSEGIYFLQLITREKVLTGKLVVQF